MEDSESDRGAPRKLDDDDQIVTYLLSIEREFEMNKPADEIEILIDNVLLEIKTRTASAASDRRTNFIIEKIVYGSNVRQILEIMNRFHIYITFLARNRYSSHIMQGIMARLCYLIKLNDIGDVNIQQLESSVVLFCESILKEITWLCKDLCGSHVIRAAICTLIGMPVISERKGKTGKHQHAVSLTEPLETLLLQYNEDNIGSNIDTRYFVNHTMCFDVPPKFHEVLKSCVSLLQDVSTTDLHEIIADQSGCAVISLIVRIFYNNRIISGGSDIVGNLILHILDYDENELSKMKVIVYNMSGDKAGSYFMQAVLECCDITTYISIVQNAVSNNAIDYIKDNFGNFVIQSILKRLSSELESNDKNNRSDNDKGLAAVAKVLVKEMLDYEQFSDILQRRGGVILWYLHVIRMYKTSKYGDRIGDLITNVWTSNGSVVLLDSLNSKLTKKEIQNKAAASNEEQQQVPYERDTVQILISKIIGGLMRLKGTNVSNTIVEVVCQLPLTTVRHIATSGNLSKAILDVFFTVANSTRYSQFLENMMSCITELAVHYVGQHALRRAYEGANVNDKERMVQAIVAKKDVIGFTKEGKNTMRNFYIDLYMKSKEDWKNLLRKQGKAVELLKEVTSFSSPMKKDVPAATTDGAVDKKRKRKRNRAKATHQKFDDDEDEDGDDGNDDNEDNDDKEDNEVVGHSDMKEEKVIPKPSKSVIQVEESNKKQKHVPSNSNGQNSSKKVEKEVKIDVKKIKALKSNKLMSIEKLSEIISNK